MKRRVLSLFLAFALCFSSLPLPTFAEKTDVVTEQEETEVEMEQEEAEEPAEPEAPGAESTTDEGSDTEEDISTDGETIDGTTDESAGGGAVSEDDASADTGEQDTEKNEEEDEAVQTVQALIDALPDEVTAENADELQAQLAAIDEAMAALTEEQIAALDMERYDAICAALAGLVAVQDGEHIHPICGATCNDDENHQNVTWTPTSVLTDDMEAGNYYLTTDITLEHQWAPTNKINLCLNGHNITFTKNNAEATDQNVIVIKNVRLNLCDAHGQGAVIAAVNESTGTLCGGVYIENGVFNLYNDAKINAHDYGVWINQNGSFTMYGGTVTGKAREGVHVSQAAEFDMKGGEISGCETNGGVLVMGRSTSDSYSRVGGKFNMTGGKICNNTSTDAENGGGVTVYYGQYGYGSFTMEGGEISGNKAKSGNGGGVYIKCNADDTSYYPGSFTMIGGEISGNTASGKGGGVYVEANKSSKENIAMFYFGRDSKIIDNTDSNVYLCDNNTITISWNQLKSGAHIGVTLENLPEEGAYTVIATSANNGYVEDAITSDNADYTILRSDDEVIIYSKTTKLHTHPVCGKTCDHDVAHASVVWKGVSSLDEITTSGYYYLTQNIELTKTWSPVPGVKLCLNGHNITANADVDVITMPDVGSFMIFTLTDCMGENGTTYGKITHAEGKTGHGIYVKNRVVMYGGEISGNTVGTYKNGGGVYVYDFCEFEMHGGSITGNSANYGGGVYFRDISEFTMDGGSITDNSASRGGGVYLSQGSFTVSGKAKITNNTLSDKTTANNVGGWGYIIKVDTPGLDSTASIGVTTSDIAEGSYVVVAEGIEAYKKSYQLKEKDLKCFSSDVADYTPKLINNNIVFTNGDVHEHAICGEKDCEDGHDAALWIPLTYDAASHDLKYGTSTVTKTEGTYNGSKYYTYTLPAGNYYLKEDIALPGSIRINGDVNICLNGKTISAKGDGDALFFLVKNKLTVCDCLDGGKISVTDSRDAVYLWTGNGGKASFNLYGGTITESRYGVSGLGTVGLYGGTITGNNYGEALSSGSSLTIGGDVKIIGNTKRNVYLDFGQTITIDHSLTQNARIGVITYSQPSADTKVQIATGADADLDYTQIFTSDVTDKNYVVTKDEKGDLYLGIHQHHWVCSAEGATIKIECDADNCKLGDDFAATYTVMAPAGDDLIYSGSEKPASVTVSGDATGVTLPEVPGITYQKESGNGYEALDEAPKDAGTYKASIALNGVTASVTYTIVSKKVTDPTIEVTETYTYDGIAKKPSVVVKDGDKVIDKGEYEVSYENNTNAGDAAIVKIADAAGGNYDVSGSTLFSIGKAIITVTPEEGQKKIYGETESLVLEYSSSGAVTGETPAFIGALSRAEGKDAGNYAITLGTLALKDNSAGNFMAANYELKLADTQVQFTIEPKTLTAADLEFTDSTITKIYDGNTDCTTATVQIKDSAKAYPDDAMPKVTGTYAYNSANVTEAKEVTFTSEAVRNNNYILPSGLKLTHAASITKADQAPLTIISTSATYGTDLALTVSGGTGAGKVAYTVVNGTGEATVSEDVLHPEKVGEVTVVATKSGGDNYNDVISAATVITIKKGVYSGTVSKTVNIIKNRNTVQTGTLTAADFFPEGQKPDGVKISNVNGILDGAVMRHWSLNADTGEISYTSEVNITSVTDQTCTVIITSTNYNDITATLTFQLTDKQTVTISGLTYEDRSYDGSAMKPAGTLAVSDNKVPVNDLEVRYEGTNGTIYDSAKAPVDSGTYKVTYKVADSNDDYIGSVEYTFTISPKTVTEDMIGAIDAQEYTGKAMKPEPTVKNGELTMISGKDFTFSYADNTNAGEATVTITGKGNYTGTVSRTFTIKPKNISDASIELDHDSLVYTGQPQEVQIKSVTLDGVTLKEADYDIANGSNKHSSVDDITLTIEGKGNYTGTATKIWKITKADPTRENFDVTPDLTTAQTYDGMPKWVNVEVKSGVRGMGKVTVYYEGISDTDYARSQTAPVNAGEYKVIAVVTDDGTNYNAKEIEIGTLTINKAAVPELEDITRYYAFTQTGEQTIDIGNLVPGTYGYDFSYVEGSDTGILSEHVIIDAADDLIKFTLSELTEENVGNKVTVRVTISSDNYEDATFNVIICIAPDYKIIEGANSTWKKNSKNDLVIRGNGEFAKFRDVKVDGEILESENYTAEAGSTVITLKASYLKTLSKGSHSFEILWEDGSAGTDFKIAANSSGSSHSNNNNNSTADTTGSTAAPASVTSPKTGDDLDIWLILFAISLAGTVGLLARRKKFKNI